MQGFNILDMQETNQREILIACTFREFNGDVNAQTQEAFLESLKKQTYQNYRLIVTNYKEKFVRKKLEDLNMPFEFHQSNLEIRSSWGEVIANSIQHLKPCKHIVMWTNADVIYEVNYFEEVIRHFSPNIAGTSYMAHHCRTLSDYYQQKVFNPYYNQPIKSFYSYDPNIFIPESLYIDGDLLLNEKNQKLFSEHLISGHAPGIVVILMFGFMASQFINLIYRSKLYTITSVKPEGYAPSELHDSNLAMMISYCKKAGIAKKYYLGSLLKTRKLHMAKKFKAVGSIWQKFFYSMYFLYYTVRPRKSLIVLNRVKGALRRLCPSEKFAR